MTENVVTRWTLRQAPLFPDRAREIIRMRQSGAKLKEIAQLYGMTPAGVLHYTSRWAKWYAENPV